jgi:putative sterol carrier protein
VAAFLSPEWFAEVNDQWRHRGAVPWSTPASASSVVLEFSDGPSSAPHALTFTLAEHASVTPGDDLGADAVLRLSYEDALALVEGRLDSAAALRQGRIKMRGDVSSLVALSAWLSGATPGEAPEPTND